MFFVAKSARKIKKDDVLTLEEENRLEYALEFTYETFFLSGVIYHEN